MWNDKEILLLAVQAVLSRSGDVDTEDGAYATTNIDTMINLEAAIVKRFNLDSDDLQDKHIPLIEARLEPVVAREIDIDYSAVKPDYLMKHGVNCEKVIHDGPGYDHAADYDDPYDVDMGVYCGRCHRGMDC